MPQHDYFRMDIDEALSHTAANLNKVHREVGYWDMKDPDNCSSDVQNWLLELTEAMQFLGALIAAHRQEHEKGETL